MQLCIELVLDAIKSEPVCIEVVDLFARLKLTSKGLYTTVQTVMWQSHAYRDALKNVFVVPGTKIPCGARIVLDLPFPVDAESLMQIFHAGVDERSIVPQANAVRVGGPYIYEDNTVEDCFEKQEGGLTSWYMAVRIRIAPADFFVPDNVPLLDNDMADLRHVPNIFRRVLQLPQLTHNYTALTTNIPYMENYYRMVRVLEGHTMQDVENAIADAEGWPQDESTPFHICYECGEEYSATDNVFHLLATDDEQMLPTIFFQLFEAESDPLDVAPSSQLDDAPGDQLVDA